MSTETTFDLVYLTMDSEAPQGLRLSLREAVEQASALCSRRAVAIQEVGGEGRRLSVNEGAELLAVGTETTGRYAIKCDDCRREVGRTDSVARSAEGGMCEECVRRSEELAASLSTYPYLLTADDYKGRERLYRLGKRDRPGTPAGGPLEPRWEAIFWSEEREEWREVKNGDAVRRLVEKLGLGTEVSGAGGPDAKGGLLTRGGPRPGAGRKRTVERRVNAPISVASLEKVDGYCREHAITRATFLRFRLALLVEALRKGLPRHLIAIAPGTPARPVHLEMPARLYDAAAEVVAAGKAPSLAALVRTAAEMTLPDEKGAGQ